MPAEWCSSRRAWQALARAYWGPYAVSKAALEVLARTYAAETESTNVRVNVLVPGAVRTRMRAQAMPGEDPMSLEPPRGSPRSDRRAVPAGHARERQALRLSEAPVPRVPSAVMIRRDTAGQPSAREGHPASQSAGAGLARIGKSCGVAGPGLA